MNKTFPIKGHCLSTNTIIVKYLQDNFKMYMNNVNSKKAIGVAWSGGRWWYVLKHSHTPQYNPSDIINIITEINKMNSSLTVAGTLSTSSGIMPGNSICTTTTITDPIYNPNNPLPNNIWINGVDISTGTLIAKNLVIEPTKLRIKCRNLKKSLKVSLLQINLK